MYRIYGFIILAFTLTACDQIDVIQKKEKAFSYSECIRESLQGNHNFSADDVRSLCEEITERHLSYKYQDGVLVPKDNYTKCYVKKTKGLDFAKLGKESYDRKTRIAELECKRDT